MFMMLPAAATMASLYTTDFYQAILNWDAGILLWIQEFIRNDFLTPVMKAITMSVDGGIFWIVLSVILICIPKTRKTGMCSALALVFSVIICNVLLKNLFGRIRPYEVIDGLNLLVKAADDPSFPSGHTSASFAASVAMLLSSNKKSKPYAIAAVVYAFIVGFTRLYVGIHYPTDVICAAIIASAFAVPATYLGKMLYDKLAEVFRKKKEAKAVATEKDGSEK